MFRCGWGFQRASGKLPLVAPVLRAFPLCALVGAALRGRLVALLRCCLEHTPVARLAGCGFAPFAPVLFCVRFAGAWTRGACLGGSVARPDRFPVLRPAVVRWWWLVVFPGCWLKGGGRCARKKTGGGSVRWGGGGAYSEQNGFSEKSCCKICGSMV